MNNILRGLIFVVMVVLQVAVFVSTKAYGDPPVDNGTQAITIEKPADTLTMISQKMIDNMHRVRTWQGEYIYDHKTYYYDGDLYKDHPCFSNDNESLLDDAVSYY